jgi:hypothetical protein
MAANDEIAEIMKAAEILFSERNHNLSRCTFLNTKTRRLNRRLSDAWDVVTAHHNHCQVI